MHTFIKAAALAASLSTAMALPLTATAAPVATIDFNSATTNAASATQSGFNVTATNGAVTVGGSSWCSPACAYNGTKYFWNYGPDVTVKSTTGALFSLLSFDASESFGGAYFARYTAPNIRVTGTLASGGTVTATFTMDGIDDGMGAQIDFQTFTLPTTFIGLNKIVFSGIGGAISYYGIDNIVLGGASGMTSNASDIPEPATLGLVGLALLLGGRSARRAQRQALAAV
jgi:hypothetical protein